MSGADIIWRIRQDHWKKIIQRQSSYLSLLIQRVFSLAFRFFGAFRHRKVIVGWTSRMATQVVVLHFDRMVLAGYKVVAYARVSLWL